MVHGAQGGLGHGPMVVGSEVGGASRGNRSGDTQVVKPLSVFGVRGKVRGAWSGVKGGSAWAPFDSKVFVFVLFGLGVGVTASLLGLPFANTRNRAGATNAAAPRKRRRPCNWNSGVRERWPIRSPSTPKTSKKTRSCCPSTKRSQNVRQRAGSLFPTRAWPPTAAPTSFFAFGAFPHNRDRLVSGTHVQPLA